MKTVTVLSTFYRRDQRKQIRMQAPSVGGEKVSSTCKWGSAMKKMFRSVGERRVAVNERGLGLGGERGAPSKEEAI